MGFVAVSHGAFDYKPTTAAQQAPAPRLGPVAHTAGTSEVQSCKAGASGQHQLLSSEAPDSGSPGHQGPTAASTALRRGMSLPAIWGSRDCHLPACGHQNPCSGRGGQPRSTEAAQRRPHAQPRAQHVTGRRKASQRRPSCQQQGHSTTGGACGAHRLAAPGAVRLSTVLCASRSRQPRSREPGDHRQRPGRVHSSHLCRQSQHEAAGV